MLLAATDDAAYQLGQALVPFLLFVCGLVVLIQGVRLKRQARSAPGFAPPAWSPPAPAAPPATGPGDYFGAPAPAATSSTTTQAWPPPAPVPPSGNRGQTQVVIGIVLIVLSFLATAGIAAQRSGSARTVSLPSSLLGLQRDDTLIESQKQQFLDSLPGTVSHAEIGLFGKPPEAMVVVAGSGRTGDPAKEIAEAERGAATAPGITIQPGQDVPAGALGGKGRCAPGSASGSPFVFCAYVDGGSILTVIDFTVSTVAEAAPRTLQVRDAVIHKG